MLTKDCTYVAFCWMLMNKGITIQIRTSKVQIATNVHVYAYKHRRKLWWGVYVHTNKSTIY